MIVVSNRCQQSLPSPCTFATAIISACHVRDRCLLLLVWAELLWLHLCVHHMRLTRHLRVLVRCSQESVNLHVSGTYMYMYMCVHIYMYMFTFISTVFLALYQWPSLSGIHCGGFFVCHCLWCMCGNSCPQTHLLSCQGYLWEERSQEVLLPCPSSSNLGR